MKILTVVAAIAGVAAASPFGLTLQKPLFGQGDNDVPGESPFKVCDQDLDRLLDIDYIDLDPNPPTRGANLTIAASGYLKEDVEEGSYVEVEVRYGYIRLLSQVFDLCEQISNVDLQCPMKKGHQKITKTVQLPNEIPPGKYLVTARAYTDGDDLITCLTATVEFPIEL
uniref:Phosphatidylglycerol/phosphatidylinositol transfer protein n=1 Tax=Blastobotrys adeninivorans TaxID=409370 RepID=A0A060SXH7_BLAAD